MSATEETIKRLVRDMNAAWLEDRIDELNDYFADDVVLIPPGDHDRMVGREAIVESFRQYTEHATTHEFEETRLLVDVMGSTAVARLQFKVRYELAGRVYDEVGQDLLVLTESDKGWQIVWRTQLPEDTTEG